MNNTNPKEVSDKNDIVGKNIAVYLNMASISPPIELHTATIMDLLSRDNKITVYICDRSFKSPMDNPFNRRTINNFRMFRIHDALRGLNVRIKMIDLRNVTPNVPAAILEKLETGTMSSFASMFKAQEKSQLSPKWTRAYDNMLDSGKKLYTYFIEEIPKEKYDFVFMFNGRFGDVRPALEATKQTTAGYGLYEMKKSINEIVFINQLVHSIQGNTDKALKAYAVDNAEAEVQAKKFFERKTENKETGDPIYTQAQKQGSLPDAIVNTDKKVIAIYPTTDDEYKFIGKEWDGIVPADQVAEIEKMASGLINENYILVVKMHPNQINTAENTIKRYLDLATKYKNIVVEPPLSEKDTYALMNRADIVVTFASTIGVEACYAGKPVVLIGDTNWSKMDVAHATYSGDEAATLIKNGVEPKSKLGAIIWGNYAMSYRDELPAFKLVGKGNFFINDRRIGKSTLRRILQLPAKLEIDMSRPGFRFGKRFFLRVISTIGNIIKGKWATK
jgi:hypothetical protein